MKNLKKILFAILFTIFTVNLFFRIASYSKEYTTPFDPLYWTERYLASQWVVADSKNSIGDDGLYTYAGWAYVNGANPALLNAELPPLGKYIIGLGEVAFKNQNILMLIMGLACLLVLYLLNLKLFKDKLVAFVPVFIFSLDPLFYTQLRAPFLDTTYFLFLLLTLYFTIRKKYFLASLFLGCFASIKFPVGSLFLALPVGIWVFLFDRTHIKKLFLSLLLWPVVFILFYLRFFILGGTLLKFLEVQKWIVSFYSQGAKSSVGIIYPLILFGQWYTWFGGVQKVAEWTFIWPVSFIGLVSSALPLSKTIFLYLKSAKHKANTPEDKNMLLVLLWVVFYLLMLTFTPVFPRYLLLLLPFMYNLTVWFLIKYVFRRLSY